MKRGMRKLVSTVLVASMVLASAATSALAAEPDSVQEFRQGKTKMVSSVNSGAIVLQEDGTLWGWGRVDEGSLGNGGNYDEEKTVPNMGVFHYRTYPEKLMADVAFVNAGGLGEVTLAIKTDGTLWYTGNLNKVNTMGMLATNREYQETFKKLTDHVVSADYGWGEDWTEAIYAVKDNGELWRYTFVQVWDYGEEMVDKSGNAIEGQYHFDIGSLKVLDNVERVSACNTHVLALKKDGSIWAWGENQIGQIGNGKQGQGLENIVTSPVKILEDAKEIYTGYQLSAAIKTDGSLWVWGERPDVEPIYNDGEMVSGFETTPVKIMDSVKDVAIDLNSFMVLTKDGNMHTWGNITDFKGALESSKETLVTDVEISHQALFVVKEDGSLWAIGDNQNWTFGMQGIGTKNGDGIDIITTPVQLTGMTKTASNDNSTQTTSQVATPTASKVLVNGKEISFDAYEINGNNYFKLRDIANVVSGTGKQFEVTWDGTKNAINLLSNKAYTAVGGELAKGDGSQKTAALNASKVYLDGKEISLTAYTINDNNYFKLRDLGQTFNFGVGWDGAANTVTIDTSIGYTAE